MKNKKGILVTSLVISGLFSMTSYAEEPNVDESNPCILEGDNIITEDMSDDSDLLNGLNLLKVEGDENPDPDEEILTGWQEIDGDLYYYDENGDLLIGWQMIEENWYFFDGEGVLQTGWLEDGTAWYYLDEDGIRHTGWAEIKGRKYLFDSDGKMLTGWQSLDGAWFYFDENGRMKTGWLESDGNWYHLDENGVMERGLVHIGSKVYFFDTTGRMKTGWVKWKNRWYYMKDTGAAVSGWLNLGEKWYFFDNQYIMQTGWLNTGSMDSERWYYFSDDGKMQVGWKEISGKWYYFQKNGRMTVGWLEWSKSWYFFSDNGAMKKGWLEWSDNYYFMDEDGKMYSGRLLSWKGKDYFFSANGKMVTDSSFYNGSDLMYAGKSGAVYYSSGWITSSGKSYLAHDKGLLYHDVQMKVNGTIYYFLSDGSARKSQDPVAGEKALQLKTLRAAFNYVAKFKYGGKYKWTEALTSKQLAAIGIDQEWGNCFVYAGTFRELACEMGYDAHQVWGYVPYPGNRVVKHSWVEIVIDGETYVYDPEASWQFKKDFYHFQYGDSGTFRYQVSAHMN